jgi:hypothetical protein
MQEIINRIKILNSLVFLLPICISASFFAPENILGVWIFVFPFGFLFTSIFNFFSPPQMDICYGVKKCKK